MKIENLRKRALAFLAASLMLLSTTGCGNSKSNYLLKDTILDNAIIASVDGNLSLVRWQSSKEIVKDGDHSHYFDIITGEWITDNNNCTYYEVRKVKNIKIIDNVLDYLEPEELEKAFNKTLTNEDIVKIIARIKEKNENNLTLVP